MAVKTLMDDLVSLFEAKQRQFYVAALAITHERASAEDVVHDALLAMSALKVRPDNLEAYLFRTIRNRALHRLKDNRRFEGSTDVHELLDLEGCSAERQVLAQQVVSRLHQLDNNQRQTLIMKLFAELTFDEIARITETSPNTVASWYRRGLARLKECIYEYHE